MYSGEHFEECRKVDRYSTVKVPELPKKLWDVTEDILRLQLENMKFKFWERADAGRDSHISQLKTTFISLRFEFCHSLLKYIKNIQHFLLRKIVTF
jgi:hypothetical protein